MPKLRFKGFTDDWEQRKLGDMVSFSKGTGYSKSDLQDKGTPIILYGRLYTKYETVISDVDTFAEEKPKSVFSKGREVIVPASGETAEDISVASVVEKEGVLLGGDLNIITPPADLDSAFLALSISNGKPHNDMAKMAQGKSVVHLHNSDLAKIDLLYPSYKEQCKISTHFANIDNLITLQERKCDNLKAVKKYMLQKMFPKKGEKVPETRFAGFTGDWEKRKLGDISPLRGGFAFKSSEYGVEGVPIVRISNILSNGTVGAEFAYYEKQENDDTFSLYDGDAVLAMSGATTGKVSILHADKGHKYYQNQRVGYFMPTKYCDYGLICSIVKSQRFIEQLSSVLVAGAQPNVSSKEINSFEFMIPKTKDEQHRIGKTIKALDNLITLHQRKCDTFKEIKKYMLQNMFPKK